MPQEYKNHEQTSTRTTDRWRRPTTGKVVENLSVLEEHGIAYDPTQMTVDLTKEEKRRTTALLLAIQAYEKLIIKDAEYLKEMHNEARRGDGPVIQPATMGAMVEAAIQFDAFISGEFSTRRQVPGTYKPNKAQQPETSQPPTADGDNKTSGESPK